MFQAINLCLERFNRLIESRHLLVQILNESFQFLGPSRSLFHGLFQSCDLRADLVIMLDEIVCQVTRDDGGDELMFVEPTLEITTHNGVGLPGGPQIFCCAKVGISLVQNVSGNNAFCMERLENSSDTNRSDLPGFLGGMPAMQPFRVILGDEVT